MEIIFTLDAKEDLDYWKKTNNQKVLKKIRQLIESIQISPSKGIGKPEALKNNFSGCWSRRIDLEHRIIYEITDDFIYILSLKGHYEKR